MTSLLPNYHALAVMLLVVCALVLFSRDRIPLETSSLIVLTALVVGFELFPYVSKDGQTLQASDFFLGFGHQALIAVSALMILGQGLIRSGALEPIGRLLTVAWRKSPSVSMLATLLVCAILSAFINNTPIVVMLLPILIGVALRTGRAAYGLLLPIGLVSIVGGMATTIGTSTNLLVVGVSADMGVAPFGIFDFLAPATVAGSVAIIYLWLIAPRLIPERPVPMQDSIPRVYTAQIRLNRDSAATGLSLADTIERCNGELKVERIQRGPGVFVTPLPDVKLKAGDRITTTNTRDNLREFAHLLGGRLYSGDVEVDDAHPLQTGDQKIAEVAITPSSKLLGVQIGEARLLSRHGLRLLALHLHRKLPHRVAGAIGEVQTGFGKRVRVPVRPEAVEIRMRVHRSAYVRVIARTRAGDIALLAPDLSEVVAAPYGDLPARAVPLRSRFGRPDHTPAVRSLQVERPHVVVVRRRRDLVMLP